MNLKELSDILGISQTTISRALNGYPEVNKETKKRVEEAAKKYRYAPSSVARRLAGKKAEAVGIVYPFDQCMRSSPVFLELVRILGAHLRQKKIDLFVIPGDAEAELELYERMVVSARVDAFVVMATRRQDERIKWLLERNIPFLAHGQSEVPGSYSWYDVDNRGGMQQAAAKLLALGHRKIAFINPADDFKFAWERKQGLLQAVRDRGVDTPLVVEVGLDCDAGYHAAMTALSTPEEQRPTAILCSSMANAQGVLSALQTKGLRVGVDVSVIAWDDDVADIRIPDMSVISAPIERGGERMAEIMLEIIRRDTGEAQRELQAAELILRASVARGEEITA